MHIPRLIMMVFCGLLLLPEASLVMAANTKSKTETAKKGKTTQGAIAWHRETGSVGYSHDFAAAREAAVNALGQCAHPNCEVALALRSECGAIADGPKGFKVQKGNTRAEAETKALKACGSGCKPVA